MSTSPEQIRSEIEATRQDLSSNVNALTDSVKPGNVAKKQAEKVTGAVTDLKDRIMGSDAADSTTRAVHGGAHLASDAPARARRGVRGNPLAAGLIAFGGGWLLGSLIPASAAEQQAAESLKAQAQPLTEHLTQAAKDLGSELQEPAQKAMDGVTSAAADAASTVRAEAQAGAADLTSAAQDSADEVKSQVSS